MTYKELLPTKTILNVVDHCCEWPSYTYVRGYWRFMDYLAQHLGVDRRYFNVHIEQDVPENQYVVPYEHHQYIEPQGRLLLDAVDQNVSIVVNLPSVLSNDAALEPLLAALKRTPYSVAVIHDMFLVDFNLYGLRAPIQQEWLGSYGMAHYKNLREANTRIMEACAFVAVPSEHALMEHERVKVFGNSNRHILAHPMDELLAQFKMHGLRRDESTVLMSIIDKAHEHEWYPVAQRYLENGYHVVSPLPHHKPFPDLPVRWLNFPSAATLYWWMQRSAIVRDMTRMPESFGFFPREALYFGAQVFAHPRGALKEIDHPNFVRIQ